MQIIDKGRPKHAWPGIKDRQVPLRNDQTFIPGLLSAHGPMRLTFKEELGEIWIRSATRTQRISMARLKIEAQDIAGHEEYSILRLGQSREVKGTSNYWLLPQPGGGSIKIRTLGVE